MNEILSIPVTQPFNWDECRWFLDRGFEDGIYQIAHNKVYRAFNIAGEKMLIAIDYSAEMLRVTWLVGEATKKAIAVITQFIKEWFDLDSDLTPFYKKLSQQKALAYMVDAFSGLRFIGIPDLFESLVWGIIGQNVNLTFAYKIKNQLVQQYGTLLDYDGKRYFIFPTPEILSKVSLAALRELQLTYKKAEYLLDIANRFSTNTLSKEKLLALPDCQARQKFLTDIKGIGIWTANYVLMKGMREQSCIPYGDAGLNKALIDHHIIYNKQDLIGINRFFENFSGWESYLTFYLWRSLAAQKQH